MKTEKLHSEVSKYTNFLTTLGTDHVDCFHHGRGFGSTESSTVHRSLRTQIQITHHIQSIKKNPHTPLIKGLYFQRKFLKNNI